MSHEKTLLKLGGRGKLQHFRVNQDSYSAVEKGNEQKRSIEPLSILLSRQ